MSTLMKKVRVWPTGETEEVSDQNSNKDQDSDVSFQEDTEEEIDATENEEDWIECIQKKHQRGWGTYEKKHKITMLDWNTQKISVANGKENCFPTWKKGGPEEFSTGIPDLTSASEPGDHLGRPKKKGKTISTNSWKQTKHKKRQSMTSWTVRAGWWKQRNTQNGRKWRTVCEDLVATPGSKS